MVLAQCDAGDVEIDFVIDTDAWGYEMYWELTLQEPSVAARTS